MNHSWRPPPPPFHTHRHFSPPSPPPGPIHTLTHTPQNNKSSILSVRVFQFLFLNPSSHLWSISFVTVTPKQKRRLNLLLIWKGKSVFRWTNTDRQRITHFHYFLYVNLASLEQFQRQQWENFRETGWSSYGLFRAHRYHHELGELNWNEFPPLPPTPLTTDRIQPKFESSHICYLF